MGREWSDGAGNLFASTIVRLRPGDPSPPTLTLVAAVALAEAVAGVAPGLATIKWPNDLLIDGAKLSGILLERGSGNAVVIGLGVNLASHPTLPDRATTSLAAQGVVVSPGRLLELLGASFARWLVVWRTAGMMEVRAAWEAIAHPVGTELSVRLPDGQNRMGTFAGLDARGALRLRLAGGEEMLIHAGDVLT